MRQVDCLIVGAGPAGLCAATEVAKSGASVILVDENDRPGGQLFKQIHKFFGSQDHYAGIRGFKIAEELYSQAKDLGVEISFNTLCWGIDEEKVVALKQDQETQYIKAKTVLIATGASEKAISFDGSNIPGVLTAGAVQTMINVQHVKPGSKAIMVGSGNVGLIVAYQMMQAGIEIVGLVEVVDHVTGYDVHKNKLLRAGVPMYLGHTVVKAIGDTVQGAVIRDVKGDRGMFEIECDLICLAVGLKPRIDLLEVLNIDIKEERLFGGNVPYHNESMEVRNGIFVAGDASGVEEASSALEEGRLAGFGIIEYLELNSNSEDLHASRSRLDSIRSGTYIKRRIAKEAQLIKREDS